MGRWVVSGPVVRVSLYAAVLATGAAFGNLFAGGAHAVFVGAALVALLVGSSGRWRFVLLFPTVVLYTLLASYRGIPLSPGEWKELISRLAGDISAAADTVYAQPLPYESSPGLLAVLVPLVMVVAMVATSLTLYEESPVISVAVLGLTISVLSATSLEAGIGPYFAAFLVAGVVLALPKLPIAEAVVRPALADWSRIGGSGGGLPSPDPDRAPRGGRRCRSLGPWPVRGVRPGVHGASLRTGPADRRTRTLPQGRARARKSAPLAAPGRNIQSGVAGEDVGVGAAGAGRPRSAHAPPRGPRPEIYVSRSGLR